MFKDYLNLCHSVEIIKILQNEDENKHFSININFVELFEHNADLGNSILHEPTVTLFKFDASIRSLQNDLLKEQGSICTQEDYKILREKPFVHARIFGLPICPELHKNLFPRNFESEMFLQLSGTVVRITMAKLLEYQKSFVCTKCKHVSIAIANYEQKYRLEAPKKCANVDLCKNKVFVPASEKTTIFFKDYQEIKIQEEVSRTIPNSMWVTLEDDLVDLCKPGDSITVCGILKRRWGPIYADSTPEIDLVLKANHIQIDNYHYTTTLITPDIKEKFRLFWDKHKEDPLIGRDLILKSFCPQLFGLHFVKLAVAIILAGGSHVQQVFDTNVRVRSEAHILLVGDPGTGKSQLLRFASKVIPRSVLTTGVGSTTAGLTVAAVMENGEWHLEGGALVLADGGICCIDELSSMKERDRIGIHEAMEQQTISVAKASLVCKFRTQCSILAATNPKGNLDPNQPLSLNIGLASPLLSRFDLVLLLRDSVDENWDSLVADYIIKGENNQCSIVDSDLWNLETLQAYYMVIKKNNPMLTEEAEKILSTYYQENRRETCRNKARTTVRMLDSLIRLSQGHARLMFHTEVEIVDAVFAVVLVEMSMEQESSILSLNFNCHTYTENPNYFYRNLVSTVLENLKLTDLLVNKTLSSDSTHNTKIDDSNIVFVNENTVNFKPAKIYSKEILPEGHQSKQTDDVDNENYASIIKKTIEDSIESSSRFKMIKKSDQKSKTVRTKQKNNEIVNLNQLRDVNESFDLSILDFDYNNDNQNEVSNVCEAVKPKENVMSTERNDLQQGCPPICDSFNPTILEDDCINENTNENYNNDHAQSAKTSMVISQHFQSFECQEDYEDVNFDL